VVRHPSQKTPQADEPELPPNIFVIGLLHDLKNGGYSRRAWGAFWRASWIRSLQIMQDHEDLRASWVRFAVAGVLIGGLAYALSWAWVIPLAVTHQVVDRGQGWPTHYPALFGPAVAAFLVVAATTGRRGIAELLRRVVLWRVGWRWWLVAFSPLSTRTA